MDTANTSCSSDRGDGDPNTNSPQFAALDFFIPGFSVFSSAIKTYLGIDLSLYIPLIMVICGGIFLWNYMNDYFWRLVERYLMSSVRIRTDDEIYNMMMTWVARQKFSQRSRRFIVNTNVNSRLWWMFRADNDEEEDDGVDATGNPDSKKKNLQYTPSFGSHFFWYKGRVLLFERHENREQAGFLTTSEREHLAISCFGRDPGILKELLIEARLEYMKKDEHKTLIYRGAQGSMGSDPSWQRCMSRSTRPFSTVILSEKTKKDLIEDVTDYLNPATRRWYANRGIPYRRGYLLHGPPGTGKSSLSLALAGYFRMRIYIVSLSSVLANEENLSSLFNELPRRCVVLLEDIDSAGLTHTREGGVDGAPNDVATPAPAPAPVPAKSSHGAPPPPIQLPGRLSLSGLLNILDGVASQEGRILIMTTNHVEKLDKALIRPGRVDMTVQFGLADAEMTASIFRAIYAPYEGEAVPGSPAAKTNAAPLTAEETEKAAAQEVKAHAETTKRVEVLAQEFASKVPSLEFSPAEIQGLLLRHKRDPEGVTGKVEEWCVQTRKDRKEKEVEKAEKARKEEEALQKKEEKKKKRAEKRKAQKKKGGKKNDSSSEESDSASASASGSSDESSESEKESKPKKKGKSKVTKAEESGSEKDEKDKGEKSAKTEKTEKNTDNEAETDKNDTKETEGKKGKKSPSDSGYDT